MFGSHFLPRQDDEYFGEPGWLNFQVGLGKQQSHHPFSWPQTCQHSVPLTKRNRPQLLRRRCAKTVAATCQLCKSSAANEGCGERPSVQEVGRPATDHQLGTLTDMCFPVWLRTRNRRTNHLLEMRAHTACREALFRPVYIILNISAASIFYGPDQ